MDGFDPLFDEEIPTQSSFSLSLPTFEFAPPLTTYRGENDNNYDFFDQNVGTIALHGSHDSEHPQASSSSVDLASSGSKSTSQRQSKGHRKPSKQARTPQIQQPYVPASLHDMVLGQLAKDPNVVPLLQAIVEYVYKTNLVPAQSRLLKPSFAIPESDVRPIKRRRLQRVPAGAEGWTIPFPFPQGEGPQHYREMWEMKRLIVLLGSLIRNLKNWRARHGTVSFSTQPKRRTFRKKQAAPEVSSPSPTPTMKSSPNDLPMDEDFFAQLQIPNPSQFDLSLESLLGVITSYDSNNESALNVDLGALSMGAPISDILFTTPANLEQTVPWDDYAAFSNIPNLPDVEMDLDPSDSSMHPVDMAPRDTPELSYGSGRSTAPSLQPTDDSMLLDGTVDQFHQQPFSGLGLDIAAPRAFQEQEEIIPDDELQNLLNMALSSYTITTPSMTASPSIATPTDLATPRMPSSKQLVDQLATTSSTPTAGVVATLSKRGRPRTTAALRRDLNKQLRQNPVESGASSPASLSAMQAPLPPITSGSRKTKKKRASEATVKAREELLGRAKEWREVMAKELENARMARWEIMMEGMVLREIGVLVRKTDAMDTEE